MRITISWKEKDITPNKSLPDGWWQSLRLFTKCACGCKKVVIIGAMWGFSPRRRYPGYMTIWDSRYVIPEHRGYFMNVTLPILYENNDRLVFLEEL